MCFLGQTDLKSVLKKIACDEAVFAPQLACSYLAVSAYIQSPGDWQAVNSNVQGKVRERRTPWTASPHRFRCELLHRILYRKVCLKVRPIVLPAVKPRESRFVSAREVRNRDAISFFFLDRPRSASCASAMRASLSRNRLGLLYQTCRQKLTTKRPTPRFQ